MNDVNRFRRQLVPVRIYVGGIIIIIIIIIHHHHYYIVILVILAIVIVIIMFQNRCVQFIFGTIIEEKKVLWLLWT